MEGIKCDDCGKPAVYKIAVLTRIFYRCKEHRHVISREYQNFIIYEGEWYEIWNVGLYEKGWNSDETMDDVRRKGLEKQNIPPDKYLD